MSAEEATCGSSSIDPEFDDVALASKPVKESAKKEKTWKVSVELDGGLAYQLAIPASAKNPTELKQAIAAECLRNLGPDLTPGTWLGGQLDAMAVQYIGPKGEPKTLKETTEFDLVRGSRVLRVTQRAGKAAVITAASEPPLPPTVNITPQQLDTRVPLEI